MLLRLAPTESLTVVQPRVQRRDVGLRQGERVAPAQDGDRARSHSATMIADEPPTAEALPQAPAGSGRRAGGLTGVGDRGHQAPLSLPATTRQDLLVADDAEQLAVLDDLHRLLRGEHRAGGVADDDVGPELGAVEVVVRPRVGA